MVTPEIRAEILRLHYEEHRGAVAISRAVNLSRVTVWKVLKAAGVTKPAHQTKAQRLGDNLRNPGGPTRSSGSSDRRGFCRILTDFAEHALMRHPIRRTEAVAYDRRPLIPEGQGGRERSAQMPVGAIHRKGTPNDLVGAE